MEYPWNYIETKYYAILVAQILYSVLNRTATNTFYAL